MSFIYIPSKYTAVFKDPVPGVDIFVNNRAKTDLYIRSKSEPAKIIKQTFFSKKHVPFLKSHLQKCIRLGKFDLAIKTAITLIDLDLTNLLRRLTVIVLEDACLISSYPVLVWLMMATSGIRGGEPYQLSLQDINLILGTIFRICQYKSYFSTTPLGGGNGNTLTDIPDDQIFEMYQSNDILMAIYYRILYRGMKCDQMLLKHAIQYYYKNPIKPYVNIIIEYYLRSELNPNEILLSAIDYHPFPYIINDMLRELPDFQEKELKYLIWNCSSALNIRKKYTFDTKDKLIDKWKLIEPVYKKYQTRILNKIIKNYNHV